MPSLYSLARMNNICLLFPIYILYVRAILNKDEKLQLYLLPVICVFKPQLLVLIGIDFMRRKYKFMFTKILLVLTALITSIGFQAGFKVSVFKEYISILLSFGSETTDPLSTYPQNTSIIHGLAVIYDGLGFDLLSDSYYSLSVVLFLIFLIVIIVGRISHNPILVTFCLIFVTLFGLTMVTSAYYLILLNAITVILLIRNSDIESKTTLLFSFLISSSFIMIPYFREGALVLEITQLPYYRQIIVANMAIMLAIIGYIIFFVRNLLRDLSRTLKIT